VRKGVSPPAGEGLGTGTVTLPRNFLIFCIKMACSGALWSMDFKLNHVPACKRRRLKEALVLIIFLSRDRPTQQGGPFWPGEGGGGGGGLRTHRTPLWSRACVKPEQCLLRCYQINCVTAMFPLKTATDVNS